MADMQRPGRVGRNEFDQRLVPSARIAAAVVRAGRADRRHDAVPGGGGEVEIDEAGAGDFRLGDQRGLGQLGENQLRQLTRIAFQRACQLHRGIAGKIAVSRIFRAFEFERERGIGRHGVERILQQGDQGIFKRKGWGHAGRSAACRLGFANESRIIAPPAGRAAVWVCVASQPSTRPQAPKRVPAARACPERNAAAFIRLLPAGCTSRSASAPLPQATTS